MNNSEMAWFIWSGKMMLNLFRRQVQPFEATHHMLLPVYPWSYSTSLASYHLKISMV